jgi:hypothetical protein
MLTPRHAILAAALLFTGYVLVSVFQALAPPELEGAGADSYNAGREGTRALVALLEELQVPVERQIGPPTVDFPIDAALLLIAPDPVLVRTEPEPLRRVGEWVRRGGRVIVAPDFADADEEKQLEEMAELEHYNADVLTALGLPDVKAELMLSSDVPEDSPADDDELIISQVAESSDGPAADQLKELYTLGDALPEISVEDKVTPLWRTQILDAQGKERTLAAGFSLGAGEIILLSDSTLLSNVTLARGQNALWLTQLILSGGKSRAIVDEFYHGLSVRGNSWWLLTRPAYAAVAVCSLFLLGLWTWRSGVLLGPPLADAAPNRRAIGEYIEAMGRFFLRGRASHAFVLDQLRAGVWRRLSQEAGLPPGHNDLDRLVAALARRDPLRAERVRAAFLAAEELSKQSRPASAKQLDAARRLSECVSPDR